MKHARVLVACIDAGIEKLPRETAEYFGRKEPAEYLLDEKLEIDIPTHEYLTNAIVGYEVIISEIPTGVYKIRFYNSY